MTTNKPEAAHLADARAEFEAWASTHFFLQEEDTIIDDSDEYISVDMQLAWEAWYASRAAPDVAHLVDALERVMYCNEVAFLPESIQQAVSAALAARAEGGSRP